MNILVLTIDISNFLNILYANDIFEIKLLLLNFTVTLIY